MGRYEDLLAEAEGGDAEAFKTLREEFGTTALRDQAEGAEQARAERDQYLKLARQGAFESAKAELPEELQGLVTLDDFKETKPEEITKEALTGRATTAQQAAVEQRLSVAQAAGFDTVEAFEAAIEAGKQSLQDRQDTAGEIGGAASGSGAPAGGEVSTYDAAKGTFEQSKQAGKSDDYALGDAIETLLDRGVQESKEAS